VGIGCSDDWDEARKIMEETCAGQEGVMSDPAPETIPIELGDSANVVRLRWWTKSDRASQIHTYGRVLQAVYVALDRNGIDLPYPTQVHLFHDQTEEWDGDRSRQREGWPAGSGAVPRPARDAQKETGPQGEGSKQKKSA
jgi:small-conductance mechanosensitive channel